MFCGVHAGRPTERRPSLTDDSVIVPSYLLADDDDGSDVCSIHITTKTALQSRTEWRSLQPHRLFQLAIGALKPLPPMPYRWCRVAHQLQPDDQAAKIKAIEHIFYESTAVHATQRSIWPHLMAAKSALLVCDIDDLPCNMYLKPLCARVNVSNCEPAANSFRQQNNIVFG